MAGHEVGPRSDDESVTFEQESLIPDPLDPEYGHPPQPESGRKRTQRAILHASSFWELPLPGHEDEGYAGPREP